MFHLLARLTWLTCSLLVVIVCIFARSGFAQAPSSNFQSFSQLSDYLFKTKKWSAQDLVVEVVETQKKLEPSSLHDIAVTNKTLCGSGGCPYIMVSRQLSAQGLTLTLISSEFFGEFRLLPSLSQGRFDISVLARMGSDHRALMTLKFNGRVYE